LETSSGGVTAIGRNRLSHYRFQAYDHSLKQPLMLRTSSGTVSLYVYSGIGSPVGLLTDFSTQAFAYQFDPYGVPVLTVTSGGSGVPQNPFLFAGGIQDRATGWVKYGARWYNPAIGRWTQQDTLDIPLDPNNANRYAYAGNDPINNIDPTGRCTIYTFAAVAGTIGGAAALIGGTVGGAAGLLGGPFAPITVGGGAAGGALIGGAFGLLVGSAYAGVTGCSEA